jgi:hypothetical protein
MRLVQFMHPGPEHAPDRLTSATTGQKEWNAGLHRRKFLLSNGASTSHPNILPREGDVAFWGEWEPQSTCTLLPRGGMPGLPQWLHEPCLDLNAIVAHPDVTWQNTDPLVFGDMFRYVLCRQVRGNGNRTQLSYLSDGDVILFGSHLGGEFVLDTVFVVDMHEDLVLGRLPPRWESALHIAITMNTFELPRAGLRLYGGRTWKPGAPFSFVPCVAWGEAQMPFTRPRLQPVGPLASAITPAMKMGFKTTEVGGASEARAAWDAVVSQVLEQGCRLGTHIGEPAW